MRACVHPPSPSLRKRRMRTHGAARHCAIHRGAVRYISVWHTGSCWISITPPQSDAGASRTTPARIKRSCLGSRNICTVPCMGDVCCPCIYSVPIMIETSQSPPVAHGGAGACMSATAARLSSTMRCRAIASRRPCTELAWRLVVMARGAGTAVWAVTAAASSAAREMLPAPHSH